MPLMGGGTHTFGHEGGSMGRRGFAAMGPKWVSSDVVAMGPVQGSEMNVFERAAGGHQGMFAPGVYRKTQIRCERRVTGLIPAISV